MASSISIIFLFATILAFALGCYLPEAKFVMDSIGNAEENVNYILRNNLEIQQEREKMVNESLKNRDNMLRLALHVSLKIKYIYFSTLML